MIIMLYCTEKGKPYNLDIEKHKERLLGVWKSDKKAMVELERMINQYHHLADPNTLEEIMSSDNFKAYFLQFLAMMLDREPHKKALQKMDMVFGD